MRLRRRRRQDWGSRRYRGARTWNQRAIRGKIARYIRRKG